MHVGREFRWQEAPEQAHGERRRLESHRLLLILEYHVVQARHIGPARLAERHLVPGNCLQLDGHVLEDMAHPCSLILRESPHEPTRLAIGAAVFAQPGQERQQPLDERRAEAARGPLLELAEIDFEADDREERVHARSHIDRAIQDAHG